MEGPGGGDPRDRAACASAIPNVRLLLVGSAKFVSKATRYDNRGYLERLHRLVEELGLHDHVRFVGERDDVPSVLRRRTRC